MLNGKNVLLAVTGSIAAYKSAFIIRELITKGAHVRLIMTESACEFITPLTLSTLAKSPVIKDFVKDDDTGEWNNHVDLGIWADLMLIAPATANTMAKLVTGHADSFLLATYLSAKCPVFVAPAMDLDMYKHPSTQENIQKLIERKVGIIYPESGELASGLIGEGRLAEPENIIEHINQYLLGKASLKGKKVLISAGPTYEAIDPVRFIGNHSSGKMGFSLSKIAIERGAEVTLVSGPVDLDTPHGVNRIDVKSAHQMFNEMKAAYNSVDIVIMAAAVADYTIVNPEDEKIKKKDQSFEIKLEKTIDILNYLGENKQGQILVGFALETENELSNAKEKLRKKNLDAIILNSLKDKGAGFGTDTNKITIIPQNNKIVSFELKEKLKVAEDILDFIEGLIK
jgi:phosphopantothenoylcysteine decarboxylase/phosphopantothenate--cysteine ligase